MAGTLDLESDRRTAMSWRWRTFPVVAAFVFGALAASMIGRPQSDFSLGVRIVLVVAAALCLAHIFVAYVIAPRRRGHPSADDESESDYEDELVFEDETRA